MSSVDRNDSPEGDHYHTHLSLYGDGNADQHEEHQSIRAESQLPAEIPDSQPDGYLPAEIPDSQPDLVYRQNLPFAELDYSEVSSQLPTSDHSDLELGDASAHDTGDYDLHEQAAVDSIYNNLVDKENIDPRTSRPDTVHQERVGDSVHEDPTSNSSSRETEIIPGGTRLTNRFKVSLQQYTSLPTTLLSKPFQTPEPC